MLTDAAPAAAVAGHVEVHLLRVRLGDEDCALQLADVVEIIPMVALDRAVGADAGVCGILHYRGQLLPVFDVRNRGAAVAAAADLFIVVCRGGARGFGLVADDVDGIVHGSVQAVAGSDGAWHRFVACGDRALAVLDTAAMVGRMHDA